ncbi:MAG: isoprenyl transferase [Verrucomicrobiales bacterium]|nr:isoprenyl transferase [Verrucomicrobiales bacterium]
MSARAAKLSVAAQELLPQHVAVIMDGNGRWAKERGLPRIEGHRRGAESARAIIKAASGVGIRYLTLYTFSVENWNRPKSEVDAIMKYLAYYLKKETPELDRSNVRLEAIGQIHRLPEPVQKQLEKSRQQLSKNTGLTLVLALSYGARAEIVDASRAIAEKVQSGDLVPEEVTETMFGMHLYTSQIPDPDLLIRTSGEMRLSNFLLWQVSYAEMVVTETLWPEFRKAAFYKSLEEFAKRHRRFGKL